MDGIQLTLKDIGPAQMLLAWLFVACYALALNGMLGSAGSARAGGLALASALGFIGLSDDWVPGALLVFFAVGGMALFVASAWLLMQLSSWYVSRAVGPLPAPRSAAPAALPATPLRPVEGLRTLRPPRTAS